MFPGPSSPFLHAAPSPGAAEPGWRPRAILFDLDDTLLDSSRADSEALRQTLITFHHEFRGAPLEFLLGLHRDILKEAREVLHHTGVWANPPDRLGRLLHLVGADSQRAPEMGAYYYRVRRELLAPFPGIVPFLSRLREHYRLAIVSNAPAGMQQEVLKGLGMAHLFEAVIVAGEVGVRKPDPLIFLEALKALHVPPEEALMVGDSYPLDVLGAMNVGVRAVHVTGHPGDGRLNLFHKPGDPLEGPCFLTVRRATELEAWLLPPQ